MGQRRWGVAVYPSSSSRPGLLPSVDCWSFTIKTSPPPHPTPNWPWDTDWDVQPSWIRAKSSENEMCTLKKSPSCWKLKRAGWIGCCASRNFTWEELLTDAGAKEFMHCTEMILMWTMKKLNRLLCWQHFYMRIATDWCWCYGVHPLCWDDPNVNCVRGR